MAPERLQKVLASAGIASRRDCEVLIAEGRVVVNGEVVQVAGTRVDPDVDTIIVDGNPLGARQPRTYIMFHKPVGVVSTSEDPQGRPTVIGMVDVPQRLHLVGRLDFASEGLMLLTDDGSVTQALTHPSNQVEKEYHALLDATPSADDLREWRKGITLPALEDEGSDNDNYDEEGDIIASEPTITTAPAWVTVLEQTDAGTWLRVVLHEGRKRQIRRVAKALGYEVLRLIRMREGPIVLGDLAAGAWRPLTDEESAKLQQHAEQAESMARAVAQRAAAAERKTARIHTDNSHTEQTPANELKELQDEAVGLRRVMTRDDDDKKPRRRDDDAPRTDAPREERPSYGSRPRGDRPAYGDRPRGDRPAYGDRNGPPRGDRPAYGDRPRGDRPSYGDRNGPPRGDRPAFGDRSGPPRGDRPAFGDRSGPPRGDRPAFGDRSGPPRGDRPAFGDRSGPPRGDRPGFGDRPRSDRPAYGDSPRSDRPNFSDRPRGGFGDRPSFPPRGDRPSFGDRNGPPRGDRPAYGDRPSFDRSGPPRGDRPSFGDRNGPPRGDRPSFNDRPPRDFGNERPSFDRSGPPRGDRPSFNDRPPRDFGNERPSFERSGPPRGDRPSFDRSGPPRGDRPSFGDRSGPPRRDFGGDRSGPPRGGFSDRSGPPRGNFRDDRGAPPPRRRPEGDEE